jgi:dTMP kinase
MYERRKASNEELDRMEMSTEDFYNKVREGYHELAKEEPERFIIINGKQSVEAIQQEIWKVMEEILPSVE